MCIFYTVLSLGLLLSALFLFYLTESEALPDRSAPSLITLRWRELDTEVWYRAAGPLHHGFFNDYELFAVAP